MAYMALAVSDLAWTQKFVKPLFSYFLGIRHSAIICDKILAKLNVQNVVKPLHY